MPESVQGVIAARLDRLPREEKALLQDAAVLGKVFWLGGIVDGRSRRDAEAALHALHRKGFVERARASSVAEEHEYTFLHMLVRDVAYGQIPRGERAEKHQRAAEWIESLGRPDDDAETLAHHYLSALKLARSSGQPTHELVERARARSSRSRRPRDRAQCVRGRGTRTPRRSSSGPPTIANVRGCLSYAAASRSPARRGRANSKRQRAPSRPRRSGEWRTGGDPARGCRLAVGPARHGIRASRTRR